nr:unnamed protein product [Digitaria exilis]
MEAAPSQHPYPSPATWDQVPFDPAMVARRKVGIKFLDHISPGLAYNWAEHAYFLHKRGGGVEVARPLLRTALTRCADYATVYSMWVTIEEEHWAEAEAAAGGEPRAVREVFEEWRARSEADDGEAEADRELLWSRYISFEEEHGGGGERVRAVAAAAAATCPRNAEVRAECVMAEIRLGDDARARAEFDRALGELGDDDAEGRRQLTDTVRRRGAYLSKQWFGNGSGCLSFCRGWWFRPHRWWEQI